MDTVTTLRRGTHAVHETEVRRSRFLATVARTDTVVEAREVVREARSTHPGARHHCVAWILAADAPDAPGGAGAPRSTDTQHTSDDGEPAGTAGTPMLDVLQTSGLRDVTAVVTRYFGGVLLGTGGLARAYASSVSGALERASLVRLVRVPVLETVLSPAVAGRVESELRGLGARVLDVRWGSEVRLRVTPAAGGAGDSARDEGDSPALCMRVAELTSGESRLHRVGITTIEVDAPRLRP